MRRLTTFILATGTIGVLLMLSGCGQSGPLYIPGNPSTMAVPPENPQEDSEEEQQEPAVPKKDQ